MTVVIHRAGREDREVAPWLVRAVQESSTALTAGQLALRLGVNTHHIRCIRQEKQPR